MFFKDSYDYSQRIKESRRIMDKFPDRIPVICDCDPSQNWTISHRKYLVPRDYTIGQFIYTIRKRMSLKEEEAIYIIINNVVPPTSALMNQVYNDHKDADGFVYVNICKESAFG
jgi:GABA(A) receptor-associated protein